MNLKTFNEYFDIGNEFYEIDQYEKALNFYNKAIQRKPDPKNLSTIYLCIGNFNRLNILNLKNS